MGKRSARAAIALATVLALALETTGAAAAPNVSFSTYTLKQGEGFTITVSNCRSGSNATVGQYTAYIQYTAFNPSGQPAGSGEFTAEPSGTTVLADSSDASTPTGVWKYDFECVHRWSPPPEPGEGTDWSETVEIEVVTPAQLTAAEKKSCKRKSTAAARRRCRQRQAAD